MHPKGADGMGNSADPDQPAPRIADISGSTLFAQSYLSENLTVHGKTEIQALYLEQLASYNLSKMLRTNLSL